MKLFATNYDVSVYTDGAANVANTLRWAITQANVADGNTITFSGTPTAITLTSALPNLSYSMTINATGSTMITINGYTGNTIFITPYSAKTITFNYLTLQNATVTGDGTYTIYGGAIRNNTGCTINVNNCVFQNNTVTAGSVANSGIYGGAIYSKGPTSINNCTFYNNKALNNGSNNGTGGAIYLTGSAGTISNSTFDSNNATICGGIFTNTDLTCTSCTFTNNSTSNSISGGSGAVIFSNTAPALKFTDCIFDGKGNNNGGPMIMRPSLSSSSASSTGTLEITNCILKNNVNNSSTYGGGVYSAAVTTITNTEISGNTAPAAGGIGLAVGSKNTTSSAIYKSKLTMINCTVSGNTTVGTGSPAYNGYGAGVYVAGSGSTDYTDNTTLTNCTISGNSNTALSGAGGIDIGGNASGTAWVNTVTLNNCTIYNNSTGAGNGGGIYRDAAAALNVNIILNYCIIIGNTANSTANKDIYVGANANLGSTTGRNLYGGLIGATGFGYTGATETTGNVLLGATAISSILNTTYADNGGTTALPGAPATGVPGITAGGGGYVKTHALVLGGGATNPSVAGSGLLTNDQRGITRSTPDMGAYEYVTYRSKASGNWGSASSWQSGDNSTWSDVTVIPTVNVAGSVAIQNGHEITVAANATSPALTINSGGKLTINSGSTLGVTGNFNVNSDNSNGTGTFVDKTTNGGLTVTGSSTIQQYLGSIRNWYISSPVSTATAQAGYTFYKRNEPTSAWITMTTGASLNVGQGYIANLASGTATLIFTGTLNTGSVTTPSLSRSTGIVKEGFNLIGNPYPSFLNINSIDTTKVLPSFWLRSRNSGNTAYAFDTYNLKLGVGTALSGKAITTNIPPMQAFWVRVKTGQSPATLTFNNSLRSHSDNVNNVFRTPVQSKYTQQILRLQVTNGVNFDETILAFNPSASNSLDDYDSPKMSNDPSMPGIYSIVSNEQLAINGMNSIPYDSEMTLGFSSGQIGTFVIKASQFANFVSGTQIILRDKALNVEQDLTIADYSFTSDTTITDNKSRFTLLFKAPSIVNGFNSVNNDSFWVSTNSNHQIMVNGNSIENTSVSIYNAVGQKILSRNLIQANAPLGTSLKAGVYMVTISNAGKTITKKIIID